MVEKTFSCFSLKKYVAPYNQRENITRFACTIQTTAFNKYVPIFIQYKTVYKQNETQKGDG